MAFNAEPDKFRSCRTGAGFSQGRFPTGAGAPNPSKGPGTQPWCWVGAAHAGHLAPTRSPAPTACPTCPGVNTTISFATRNPSSANAVPQPRNRDWQQVLFSSGRTRALMPLFAHMPLPSSSKTFTAHAFMLRYAHATTGWKSHWSLQGSLSWESHARLLTIQRKGLSKFQLFTEKHKVILL